MTNAPASTATADLLSRLASRLAALDPARREAKVAELLAVLDHDHRHGAAAARAAGAPGVTVCEWAADAGVDGATQHLRVEIAPGPIRIAKTKAATGRALLTNGHLGADIIHVPAGEGFAPHTHPGDHLLFVLGGYGTITSAGAIVHTSPGQAYMVEGAVPHAVGGITDHVLLSVGAPHRPLASTSRQALTPYSALLTPVGSITCEICNVVARSAEELAALGCTHSPQELR